MERSAVITFICIGFLRLLFARGHSVDTEDKSYCVVVIMTPLCLMCATSGDKPTIKAKSFSDEGNVSLNIGHLAFKFRL